MHDGHMASGPGSDQAHFGIVRADSHPERKQDDRYAPSSLCFTAGAHCEMNSVLLTGRYWDPKQGYFAAKTFTAMLQGRVVVTSCMPAWGSPMAYASSIRAIAIEN
jgi:hypothetical protein